VLGVIDGDLQHPPHVLLQLLTAIDAGRIGGWHVEGGGVSSWSFVRRFLSRGAQLIRLVLLPGLGRLGPMVVTSWCATCSSGNPVGYKILIEVLLAETCIRLQKLVMCL